MSWLLMEVGFQVNNLPFLTNQLKLTYNQLIFKLF